MHTAILAGRAPHHVTRRGQAPPTSPPSSRCGSDPAFLYCGSALPFSSDPDADPFLSGSKSSTAPAGTLAAPLLLSLRPTFPVRPHRSCHSAWQARLSRFGLVGSRLLWQPCLSCGPPDSTPLPVGPSPLFLSVRRPRPRLSCHSAPKARPAVQRKRREIGIGSLPAGAWLPWRYMPQPPEARSCCWF